MGWPYEFIDLTEAEKEARRHKLDHYGLVAQLSALAPVVLFLLYRLASWQMTKVTGSSRGTYAAVPGSPTLKRERSSLLGSMSASARKTLWWLGDDVVFLGWNWGQRDQIIGGVAWTIWLLFLCVVDTGNDYFHVTKRFGIVGVSQFPVQYLLSLKRLNPFAWALRSSHEEVNRWHRVLGRVIVVLLTLHAAFYVNYYYQKNLLSQKVTSLVPVLGFVQIAALYLLNGTSFSVIRKYSYRLFFITHIVALLALPPLIYFHAHHAAFYVWESLLVILLDIGVRRFDTIIADTKVEFIPGTDLIKVVGSIPANRIGRFTKCPGTHVYVSIPAASRPNQNLIAPANLVFEVSFNPFSVASADESSGEITLVARRRRGPMTRALSHFAGNTTGTSSTVKLAFDGPYGSAKRFPNLAGPEFDRILLVAGGVGATFLLPIYHWMLSENATTHVQMVWAVRNAGDVSWPGVKSVIDDESIQLFITGGDDGGSSSSSEDVALSDLSPNQRPGGHSSPSNGNRRPDLQQIVDDTFRRGGEERVAVLVCGPESMTRELRSHVGIWVNRGRYVWWHSESFAW